MLNVILFLAGLVALAFALGLNPALADARAFGSRVLLGFKVVLFGSPWAFPKGLETLGLWVVAYWRRLLLIVGACLLAASLIVGGVVADATGGDVRSNLDAAIRAFQASVHITADGLFGPATVKAYYGHR